MALCKRVLVGIAFFLASAGLILTVSGLASLQHLCYTDDVAATNSRKLLAVDRTPVTEAIFASCQKTMRCESNILRRTSVLNPCKKHAQWSMHGVKSPCAVPSTVTRR